MRILTISAGAIIACLAAIWLIGLALPATRVGKVEGRINVPPATVLEIIRAVEAQPDWRADVAAVTRTADGWIETTTRGQEIAFTPEIMTEEIIRLRFSSAAGFSGIWEAKLLADGAQTNISIAESVTTQSPIGRILSRLFFNPQAFATTYLAELTARSEGM
jgi:hypothetical protein